MKKIFLFILCIIVSNAFGQTIFSPYLNIPVTQNNQSASLAWSGGFNSPVFSEIDLNGDAYMDLFSFEKDGNRISTYINNGIANTESYSYAPQYIKNFPQYLHDWVLLADFDCDGDKDIFTYTYLGGMEIYENNPVAGVGPVFTLHTPLVYSYYGPNYVNLFVSSVNQPVLADIDNDGDMDVLTFAIIGSNVEFHRNYSMDSLGNCSQLMLHLATDCWGKFWLSGLSNIAQLDACPSIQDPTEEFTNNSDTHEHQAHAGSCMIAVDFNGDQLTDVINGDILGNNLLYLENNGSLDTAHIFLQDSLFPVYDVPVDFVTFPTAYNFDANNDGIKDLLVTSCTYNASRNFNNILFYKNTTSDTNAVFNYIQNDFMVGRMIDVGSGANVSLLDVNADGLLDMLIGNYHYFDETTNNFSGLAYYRNTGTATQPAFQLVTRDFAGLFSLNLKAIAPTFGDIDNDGDKDMIIGDVDGLIHLFLNTAGAGNPVNFVLNTPGMNGIDVGQFSVPQLIDVDRDGLLDLIIGERAGVLNYYKNSGTLTSPSFSLVSSSFGNVNVVNQTLSITGYSAPQMIDFNGNYELFVGSERGYIYHYGNIDGNLSGTFTLIDSIYKDIFEPSRTTIAFADINNDTLLDVLVGNNAGGVTFYKQSVVTSVNNTSSVLDDMMVFPNPAKEYLFIHLSDNYSGSSFKIELHDLQGKMLIEKQAIGRNHQLDINHLSNGVYLLSVKDKNLVRSQLVIINHYE
ncbi:MAG TPA: T9SS type A sorting domain-containing protein [Bacteroidia bacterium]|nr:T9SS type A sorting domain-containing protein [Bacteroidia bacterium]HNT80534.1 T9SS type A sorting domain-containing protein [Bacteroidia bacterium]